MGDDARRAVKLLPRPAWTLNRLWSVVPSASWPIDFAALPPDCVQSVFATGAGSVIGIAVVAASSCASLSVVRTGMRSPRTGVFFCLCLSTLQPLAASVAAIRKETRKCFGLVIVILWIRRGRHWSGIDAEAAGNLDRAGAALIRNGLVLGDRGEQAAGFLLLALLDECHGGHFPGARKPRVSGLGQRLEPLDHLVRLDAVELERGLADQRGVAIRLGQAGVRTHFLLGPKPQAVD